MGKGTDEMPFSPNWVEYQPVQNIEIRIFDGEVGSDRGYYDPSDDTININSKILKCLNKKPITLPFWSPFGALMKGGIIHNS